MSNIPWNQLINNLVAAEASGHNECEKIAKHFRSLKNSRLEDKYLQLAEEEKQHTVLAGNACLETVAPLLNANSAYKGSLLSNQAGVTERLAVLHLAFEPFALSFMGNVYTSMHEHFTEAAQLDWVRRVRHCFGSIIRDEIRHVSEGKAIVKELFASEPESTRNTIFLSLRRHQKFLRLGMKIDPRHTEKEKAFLQNVQTAFQERFTSSIQGVISQ